MYVHLNDLYITQALIGSVIGITSCNTLQGGEKISELTGRTSINLVKPLGYLLLH